MPYSITTRDGITINNIPDNIPSDDPSLKQRVMDIRSKSDALEVPPEAETDIAGVTGAISRGLAPIAGGAVLGAAAGAPFAGVGAIPGAVAGAAAGGLATLVGDPITSLVNNVMGTNYEAPSEALGNFLTKLGVAEPDTETERILQAASGAAGGAGGMVALGKVLQRAGGHTVRGVGTQLAAQPVQQVAGGIGSGLAAQSVAEMGGGPGAQLAASLLGGVTGAKLGGVKFIPEGVTPQAIREAEDLGIKVLTSDAIPPRTFVGKSAQAVGERIPVAGTGTIRQAQQESRIKAVEDLLIEFKADDVADLSDDIMKDLLSKRSKDLSKYSVLKNDVIDSIDSAGVVPVPKVTAEIDRQIIKLEGLKNPEIKPVITKFREFKNAVQGQKLRNIEDNRKILGEAFKAPELISSRSLGEKGISKIYGSLREDMGDFIKTHGETRDFVKWKLSNKRLTVLAKDMKNAAFKSTINKGEATPEVINRLLLSKKPSDAKILFSRLTKKGKTNARTALLMEATKKATTSKGFSPDRFANEVKRLGSPIGVFFKGEDLKRVEGVVRAVNLTKRAMESAAHPLTGVQNVPFIGGAVLADMLGGFGAAVVGAGSTGLVARAFESAPVRNLLLKIPQTVRGSPEELALVKRLAATLQTYKTDDDKKQE